MTYRRDFLKAGLLAGVSASLSPSLAKAMHIMRPKQEWRHWAWINPDPADKPAELKSLYKKYHEAGIRDIFFEADSPMHFRIAKAEGIGAHRWIWTMNRGEKQLLEAHPEWYAVSRSGDSCAEKPPYVDYYRWLCPSRPEVQDYLVREVSSILERDYVDGIHLDYVRFCDVVLPVNLWKNYNIEQTKELPQYDYCYCEVCKEKFKAWRGMDLDAIEYPEASLSWRLFRYNAITSIVNKLAGIAARKGKPITAAVFPTPEVARRNVRQDWTAWDLTAVFPMIYHGFYKEGVAWIGDAVAEGTTFLNGKFPLYAGLFLPDFKDADELKEGFEAALRNGAAGISLFGKITEEVMEVLRGASGNIRT